MKKRIIVVGGVAGGMSFATRYRRLNQEDEIIVLDKGPYVSFANCGLPYQLSGEIKNRNSLLVVKEQTLKERFDLDIRVNHEVISVDSEKKTVKVMYDNKEVTINYDELVLSPGAKPVIPPIENIEEMPHFTLRNIPDLDKINSYIENNHPKQATIIGGGFVGIETTEALIKKGLKVNLIDAFDILSFLDSEIKVFAKETLEKNNVNIYENTKVVKVDRNYIYLDSDNKIETDFLVIAAGVKPDIDFLSSLNLDKNKQGFILVNDVYQTNIKHIYAIGDAIATRNEISLENEMVLLASPANRAGRQLADNLSGIKNFNKGHITTAIIRVFDETYAATGLNEKKLLGKDYKVIHLSGNDHASYYPGANKIYLKIIFNPFTEEILGAQAFGKTGVDKRIDVIATAIKAKMKITDLQELELTYAPMFGTAKDIINMAGYTSSNIIEGITKTVDIQKLETLIKKGVTVIDVRSNEERKEGFIKDSIHIDINQLRKIYHSIPIDKPVILYCESGARSYQGELFLRHKGYDAYNLDGSFAFYKGIYKERVVKNEDNRNV